MDQDRYYEGLLDAQQLANERARQHHEDGRLAERDALLALSSELAELRRKLQP